MGQHQNLELTEILESITRSSIRKFLYIFKNYKAKREIKQNIISLLDKSIVNSDYHELIKGHDAMITLPTELAQVLKALDK